mgnify:CR=1 FL=1
MKKVLLGLLAASLATFSAWADEVTLNPDHPDKHVVVKGDTLWDISEHFLQSPWLWPEIWHVNPQIANPHLIYPGDVVRLIYLDGKPRLTVERSDIVKLSPKIRESANDGAIPAIPLDAISAFLSRSRIVGLDEMDGAPYVIAGEETRLILGANDTLYARGEFNTEEDAWGVYRRGQLYIDPETEEVLGMQALDIGGLRLTDLDNDVATMAVTRAGEEVRIEDRLLPHEQRPIESSYFPSAPSSEIEGWVLAVEGGVKNAGKMDVVVVNKGDRDGLKSGNVLAIYKQGETVKDRIKGDMVTLPEERVGIAMVFRTFDKVSYALVLEADRPLDLLDRVRNP